MIDVDKIQKVMRADLPANFDKAILASELRKAKSWYQTRSKLDKWPKREKIVGRFITDTKRYHAALKVYSEACQDIPLPFRLPSWLNTKALDAVISEAEAHIRPLHQDKASKQLTQKLIVELGSDRGSAMNFLLGSMLPKIFRKCLESTFRCGTAKGAQIRRSFALLLRWRDKSWTINEHLLREVSPRPTAQ